MSTQVFLLQLCVELQLHLLNWELQKILCKSFNGRTLYDYSFVLKLCLITALYTSRVAYCEKTSVQMGLYQ